MNRRLLAALGSTALLLGSILPGATLAISPTIQGGSAHFTADGVYIVQLRDLPTIAYDGSTPGYAATKPGKGHKLDVTSAAALRYGDHLKAKHDVELKTHGGTKLYDYTISNNGFAARLTAAEANKMAADKDVIAIVPDEIRTLDTSSTPAFLGLSDPGGLWDQVGGVGKAGEDIIIGDIDSGIWPEAQSFSDRVGKNPVSSGLAYKKPAASWHGICQTGEDWNKHDCNNKLIGARYYNASLGGDAGVDATHPWEFNSPRDYNGHGTHTASTAGGNNGIQATGAAAAFGKISGMAPRARIAMYKALWSTQDASTASGSTSDLVAAIDQAVADGVDVINYSISGTSTNFLDPVEVSFLFAADAGIFVSQSAGNSGPTTSTVAHPGPWTTTVAAGTHNRDGRGSVTLGNGTTYNGASVATAVGPAPLIDSTAAGLSGADPTAVALCFSTATNGTPALDPAKVAGKIVVCDRGVSARTDKSLAVREAGGVGMILVNTSPNSINADFHFVPTVHLADTDRAAVKAYAATAGATATINAATIVTDAPAPFTASFSSRGPLLAGGGDLLKPDIIAPGQDILAAVSPANPTGRDFDLYSGTSMSAPHIAGIAALLMELHPTWSPMAIKSAMMTSAGDVLDGPNTNPLVIFRQGAGHVAPNGAADPGLVYDSNINDWFAFLCGTTNGVSAGTCTALRNAGYSTDPSDFNGASIAIGDLAGSQTVTRRVTNVGASAATYTATVSGMTGMDVSVSPSTLTLNPGQTKSFTVTFTRGTAALNAYVGGQLTWNAGSHHVRSPLVIKPVALAAPGEVSADGSATSYTVKFGYTGAFTATARGLVPATTNSGSVSTDPDGSFAPVAGPDVVKFDVVVPAGTTLARFALFNDATAPASDLDLYVYRGTTLVGLSGGGTSDERVDLLNPTAATYSVYVHGFATANPSTFTLFDWLVDSTNAGNMTVTAPATATLGQTGTIGLSFSGLAPATRYLGTVAYAGAAGMPNPTIVSIRTP